MFIKKIISIFVINYLCITLANAQAPQVQTFRQAKQELPYIFKNLNDPKTLYCGCDINFPKKGYKPNLESCGYKVRKNAKRAQRIEAEHMMSAWQFGHNLKCWQQGGRKNCAASDNLFKQMEGDLHNLYPALGEVNGDRNNFRFAQNVRAPKLYGKCQMLIDRKRQKANPPDRAKGIVARAHLYMQERYNIALSPEEISIFNQWNRQFKPDSNECKRNELIKKIQGNDNPFVTAKCTKR